MLRRLVLLLVPLLLLVAAAPAQARTDLPVGTDVDYQLGGDAAVPANVGIVVRDRHSQPLAGHYDVATSTASRPRPTRPPSGGGGRASCCAATATRSWTSRGASGCSTCARKKRLRLARIVGAWTRGCAAKGYDFAIAEECGRYRECADYTKFYGSRVIAIEYRRQDFDWTCAHDGGTLPVELRDLDLSPSGVHDYC